MINQQNPTVKDLTKKTEEGLSKMVQVTKNAFGINQNQQNVNNNYNQYQQGSEMQYSTQSAQYYDPNTINQPLLQNQGYSYQQINQNQGQFPDSGMNYPTFSNQVNSSTSTGNQPQPKNI